MQNRRKQRSNAFNSRAIITPPANTSSQHQDSAALSQISEQREIINESNRYLRTRVNSSSSLALLLLFGFIIPATIPSLVKASMEGMPEHEQTKKQTAFYIFYEILSHISVYLFTYIASFLSDKLAKKRFPIIRASNDMKNLTDIQLRKLTALVEYKRYHAQRDFFRYGLIFSNAKIILVTLALILIFLGKSIFDTLSFIPIMILALLEKYPPTRIYHPLIPERVTTRHIIEGYHDSFTAMLPVNYCKLELVGADRPENSHITIRFENSQNEVLSKKIVYQTVKKALKSAGIKIASDLKGKITIMLGFKLEADMIALIKNDIQARLDNHKSILKLQNQINQLSSSTLIESFYSMTIDQNKKYLPTFYLRIDPEIKELLSIQKIQSIFKECTISSSEDYITITGSIPGDQDELSTLHAKMMQKLNMIATENRSKHLTFASDGRKSKKLKPTHESTEKTSTKKITDKLTTTSQTIIEWPSGRYESDNPNGSIRHLEGGTRIPQKKFFVTSQLTRDKFDDEETYKKVNESINNCHFASARTGAQGVIFTAPKHVRDIDGNMFTSGAKLKLLGKFGDLRAYAEIERSMNDEVLCVFKGYDKRSH